jgi:hypothetical protein
VAPQHIQQQTSGAVEPTLTDWILSIIVPAIWVPSWWPGTRRFRLWFALLAPFVCALGFILGLIGADSPADGSCSSSCDGSAVQRWAESFDSPHQASFGSR